MLFIEGVFLFAFLPLVLLGWWKVFRSYRARLAFLTVMSWAFYAWFDFPTGLYLLPLLWVATSVDYVAGKLIHGSADPQRRKRVLVAAMTTNLSILGVFKYLGFFEGTINSVIAFAGGDGGVPVHDIILPVGISFYTFNSMSYTIDIYRRRVEPAGSLLEYATFVALFPHLVAGPIVRYSEIDEQLRRLYSRLTSKMAATGAFFFVVGLFKKLVIADSVAPTTDALFAASGDLGMVAGWSAALGYSFQLYFDFSAYSDMAVGLALLLGINFPQNFDSPYKAVNISDFWRRWHMTLSRWLRDYLYIPLGGSRHGRLKTLRNLVIVMFLGGLWHGAAWTFVIWGLGHGLALVIHNVCSKAGLTPPSVAVSRALTFITVVLLWVPFRAVDMGQAAQVWAAMFGANGLGLAQIGADPAAVAAAVSWTFLAMLAVLLVFVNVAPNAWEVELRPRRRIALALGGMAGASIALIAAPSPFLYFQF